MPVRFTEPKLAVSPATMVMALAPASRVSRPVVLSVAVPVVSIAPAAVSVAVVAARPARVSALSSVRATVVPVRFTEPKLAVSPASSPMVMALAPASSVASPLTEMMVVAPSVIGPPVATLRVWAVTAGRARPVAEVLVTLNVPRAPSVPVPTAPPNETA